MTTEKTKQQLRPAQLGVRLLIWTGKASVPINVFDEFGWLIGGNEAWVRLWKIEDLSMPRSFNILQSPKIADDLRCHLVESFRQKKYSLACDIHFDPTDFNQAGAPRHIGLILFPMLEENKAFKHYLGIHTEPAGALQTRNELAQLREENAALRKKLEKLKD